MPSSRRSHSFRHADRGFSLIEIMIGMVIGLIGVLVMFQMLQNWDERKRTASSGSDAQISGSIALYSIERELRIAGYGFGSASTMGCTVTAYDRLRPGTNFSFPLLPVMITDSADGSADTITMLFGSSDLSSDSTTFTVSSAATKKLNDPSNVQRGDLLIVSQSAPTTACGMVETTANINADGLTITHASGNYTSTDNLIVTARYNPAAGLATAFSTGRVFNIGPQPRRNIWQIANGRTLVSTDDLHYSDLRNTAGQGIPDAINDWTEIADGMINMQAEYGLDTNADTIIDTWQASTPGNFGTVRAIRIALLARSQQYERLAVTPIAPAWAGGNFVMTNVDGTTDSNPNTPNDWRHYRYRVYQTVIPLRNSVWGNSP